MRDIEITVTDCCGYPMPDVSVEIRQLRHHFAFGTSVSHHLLSNPQYTQFFLDRFEWAVFENESKWYWNEPSQGQVTYSDADAMYQICEENGIPVRGHCIFWAVENYVQDWVKALSDSELQIAVDNRLGSAVEHFRDRFVHWDVNNEMLHGHYFENRLGDSIRPHMFQTANALDPDCLLFVNDYNVVSGSETDAYVQQIQDLMAQGAPIHGIGAQGHFWGSFSPLIVRARLSKLAQVGLPIWITEFDVAFADEYERADNLEAFYGTAFSHPAVEGILMWGFWAGDHWRGPDAAIVNLDWTVNAAGVRYDSLMTEWTTNAFGATDSAGVFRVQGFHGTYEVTLMDSLAPTTVDTILVEPADSAAVFTYSLDVEAGLPWQVPDDGPAVKVLESYPSPMTSAVTVRLTVPGGGSGGLRRVRVELFNAAGVRLGVLVDHDLMPGEHTFAWDGQLDRGKETGAGILFLRASMDGKCIGTAKIVRIR
ncbi:MAG: endo-1,4-beta-xylanase [Candidatus Eisenbacteria bacterium]